MEYVLVDNLKISREVIKTVLNNACINYFAVNYTYNFDEESVSVELYVPFEPSLKTTYSCSFYDIAQAIKKLSNKDITAINGEKLDNFIFKSAFNLINNKPVYLEVYDIILQTALFNSVVFSPNDVYNISRV